MFVWQSENGVLNMTAKDNKPVKDPEIVIAFEGGKATITVNGEPLNVPAIVDVKAKQ